MISRLIVLGDLFKALDIARTLEPSRPISITVARSSGFNCSYIFPIATPYTVEVLHLVFERAYA
jgi:hypothetical protein